MRSGHDLDDDDEANDDDDDQVCKREPGAGHPHPHAGPLHLPRHHRTRQVRIQSVAADIFPGPY